MDRQLKRPWWQTGVVYHIYPRSFQDSNHDGIGDLEGIISRLDYLNDGTPASLAVDAIWLSPVYPSPQVDFGYDISEYGDIDPAYGTLEDFRRLLEEAHRRGIRVIMDLVLNHTSDQHPWFLESRSSRDNPKRDWYIWRDGQAGQPPNNWASYFGGSAWEWDPASGQYYLHMFTREQPDLNWRNPAVRTALFAILRFWLDLGVDGFRLDVYNQYFKDADFRSNPLRFSLRGLFHTFERQKHIYDRSRPELLEVLENMRSLVDSYPDRMLVGETTDDGAFRLALQYTGQGTRLHLAFDFDFLSSPWDARAFRRTVRKWEEHPDPQGWPTYVLSNHDVVRHITRYRKTGHSTARAKVAAAMLLTLRGTPFIYYGEELGMREGRIRRDRIMDPPGKRYWPFYRGRDGCRTPMQWDATPGAGFSRAEPWLPVNPDYPDRNAGIQSRDPDSLLNFYRKLIRFRKQHPELQQGSLEFVDRDHRRILGYQRRLGEQRMLILLNFSSGYEHLSLPGNSQYMVTLTTHRVAGDPVLPELTLAPDEVLIVRAQSNQETHPCT